MSDNFSTFIHLPLSLSFWEQGKLLPHSHLKRRRRRGEERRGEEVRRGSERRSRGQPRQVPRLTSAASGLVKLTRDNPNAPTPSYHLLISPGNNNCDCNNVYRLIFPLYEHITGGQKTWPLTSMKIILLAVLHFCSPCILFNLSCLSYLSCLPTLSCLSYLSCWQENTVIFYNLCITQIIISIVSFHNTGLIIFSS